MDLMRIEWDAWQGVCREFRAVVGEINDAKYNPLTRAIQLWGERLAALRAEQGPALAERAAREAVENYAWAKQRAEDTDAGEPE